MKKTSKFIAVILTLAFLLSFLSVLVSGDGKSESTENHDKESVVDESLVMKVGSDNALLNGQKITLFTDETGNAYGAPFKLDGVVMVPIKTLIDYTNTSYTAEGARKYTLSLSVGSVTVTEGKTVTDGIAIPLTKAPVVKSFGTKSLMYIALDDVEAIFTGYYVTYDASGMIFVSSLDNILDRSNDADEEFIKDVAKRFIYSDIDFRYVQNASGQKLVYDYISNPIKDMDSFVDSFAELDEFRQLYEMFATGTNNFEHPYIMTTQSRFDELNKAYRTAEGAEGYDEELAWYIESQIAYADEYLNKYANLEGNTYAGLKDGHWVYDSEGKANTGSGWSTEVVEGVTNHSVSEMPYRGDKYKVENGGYGEGYDPAGGRLNVLSDGETALVGALEPAALAYQITRDPKYLAFAYDWMVALCSWDHWGPGHFLNCTNTARPLATAYDWLYNDFVRVYGQPAVDELAERIYENAVHEAVVTLTGNPAEHYRYGDSSRYWNHVGNWNSCGTVGMLIASLAVMGNEAMNKEYKNECLYVIAASLGWYMDRGMTYITLDGGYRESAGYWGSVKFMHIINKVLTDTAGTDFGLMDYPGMDTADYFGAMLESSSYKRWNYHDDWEGTMPSDWYYLSAELYDNPEYVAIRYAQLHGETTSKAPHRYDLLYYNKSIVDAVEEVNLPLDYSMTTIDATIVRDSWENNSLFAGFMGGYNNVAHGQYDSGNWIYENKGIRWFVDLGADNYNLFGGGLAEGYYKYSAEGNNTLAMGSLPHGQLMDAKMNDDTIGGQLIYFDSNEYGSATIVDQKTVYGDKVEYAYRGMLFTNSRNTFVIQDEVKTASPENLYWFAHYNNKTVISVEISEDGRTAYMSAPAPDGEFRRLRVTLVSDNKDLKFEIMDTYTYLLEGTPSIDYSPSNKPGIQENGRSQYSKLVVKAEGVTELKMAVVIEVVNGQDLPELGYKEFVDMDKWTVEQGDGNDVDDLPKYTVHYNDGTSSKDFYTSRLAEGVLNPEPDANGYYWMYKNVASIDCYADVTIDNQINTQLDQKVTINLNGNMLYQNKVVRIGVSQGSKIQSGSLTINDGTLYSANVFQLRYGTTLTFNGLTYTSTQRGIRNECGNVIINDCVVNTENSLVYITNTANMSETNPHSLIINDSHVTVKENLIDFHEGDATKTNYLNTYIMGDSIISIKDYETEKLIRNTRNSQYITINLFFDEGVKLDFPEIILPENVETEEINHKYTLNYRTGMSLGDDGAVGLGEALFVLEENVFGYSNYLAKIQSSGDEEYPYVVGRNTDVSFTAKLKNNTVLYYYTDEIGTAFLTNYTDNGVREILLMKNCKLTKTVTLGNSQTLLINLNGFTWTNNARFTMGSSVSSPISCSVTVAHGTLKKGGGDGFCARMGTTLIFKDLTIEVTGSQLLWDNGAYNIIFDNCKVKANNNLFYTRIFFKEKDNLDRKVIIKNSSIEVGKYLRNYSECTADKEEFDLYLIDGSTLSYLTAFYEDTTNSNEQLRAKIAKAEFRFHIEKGSCVSYSGFGLPENTETRRYVVYAYDYLTVDGSYGITDSRQFPITHFVEEDGYYTVAYLTFVKGVKSSLTLYSDFTINFFIPVEDNLIDKVVINGREYVLDENAERFVDASGVDFFKVVIRNINPDKAADDIDIAFYSGDVVENKTYSVIDYCKRILTDDRYVDTRALVSSVADYISSAYDYTGREKPEALLNLLALDGYKHSRPEPMPADISSTNKDSAGLAIYSAQLDLGSSLNFRFNIVSGYWGTIVLNGQTFYVEDGKCGGIDYITLAVRAYDMYDPEKVVTISGTSNSGETFSGTYDLRAYISNSDKTNIALANLLSALYTYCTEAYSYKYGVVVERPDLGNTPYVDVLVG